MSESIGNSAKTGAWAEEIVHSHSPSHSVERARRSRGMNRGLVHLETGQPRRGIPQDTLETRLPGGGLPEQNALSVIQRTAGQGEGATKSASRINIEEVARKVYRLMQLDLTLERERSAK